VRIVEIVARYLLGIMFTVLGLNGFLNFIHQPPPPNPLALQFFIAISTSHFSAFFFAVQLVARIASALWILRTAGARPLGC
jgi:putative oxidoreductase